MGSLSDKLEYLAGTKSRFMQAMTDLGYEVTANMTLRDAVNLLVAAAAEKQMEDFDVSSLPDYWQAEVRSALAYTLTLGNEYVHHIVTTDNHYDYNNNEAVPIIELLQATGVFGRVINLGDVANNPTPEGTEVTKAISEYGRFKGDMLYAVGNHDAYNTGAHYQQWYEAFLENDAELSGNVSGLNYYYDDSVHRIRYIVIATAAASNGSDSASFISEFKSYVTTLPSGWGYLVLCHYYPFGYRSNYSGAMSNYAASMPRLGGWCMEDIVLNSRQCIGWIAGHAHVDNLVSMADGTLNQALLANDGTTSQHALYPKVAESASSQAITIMSVSPTAKRVKFKRIGLGFELGKAFEFTYIAPAEVAAGWWKDWKPDSNTNSMSYDNTSEHPFYMYNKPLPLFDEGGNAIQYYLTLKDGSMPYWKFSLIYKSDGTFRARESTNPNTLTYPVFLWDAKFLRWGESALAHHFVPFIQVPNGEYDADDIVFSTEMPIINTVFSEIGWREDYIINSSGNDAANENGAASYVYNVDPGATYRVTVNDAGFSTSWFMVYFYYDMYRFKNRTGSTSEGTTSITFTVPDDCHYVRLTANSLKGYTNKVRIERITP